jgi:hypothetical protein
VQRTFQNADSTDRPADVQAALAVDDGNSRRVIPAVFKPLEPLDEQRLRELTTDIGNDSAHAFFSENRLVGTEDVARNPFRIPKARSASTAFH